MRALYTPCVPTHSKTTQMVYITIETMSSISEVRNGAIQILSPVIRSIRPARNEFAGDDHRVGRSSLLFYTNFISKCHMSVAGPVTERGGTSNLFILLFFFFHSADNFRKNFAPTAGFWVADTRLSLFFSKSFFSKSFFYEKKEVQDE